MSACPMVMPCIPGAPTCLVCKDEPLSDARIDVLASRIGGHCVGAPATRDEERAMALEIEESRKRIADLTKAVRDVAYQLDRMSDDEREFGKRSAADRLEDLALSLKGAL